MIPNSLFVAFWIKAYLHEYNQQQSRYYVLNSKSWNTIDKKRKKKKHRDYAIIITNTSINFNDQLRYLSVCCMSTILCLSPPYFATNYRRNILNNVKADAAPWTATVKSYPVSFSIQLKVYLPVTKQNVIGFGIYSSLYAKFIKARH